MMSKELIVLENNTYLLDEYIAKDLVLLDKEEKEIKKKKDEIKAAILTAMEEQGIKQINDEINGLKITYTAPTKKETFDSKRFKAEHSDLYDDYVYLSDVKSGLRVTIK